MAAASSSTPQAHPASAHHVQPESLKETLISIVIAFALAFVFRGFVIEAFVIPTGSMAPTLMGAHMRFQGEQTGFSWAVGPWHSGPRGQQDYLPIQGAPGFPPVSVNDPMSGQPIERRNVRLKSGDRILVLKYLYAVREPERFDVIVFNNPWTPSERYIKRLVGLPGEQIAIADGDIFTRTAATDPAPPTNPEESWAQGDWKIARKPDHVQRAVWQPVFDSAYTPTLGGGLTPDQFQRPWVAADGQATEWNLAGPSYEYTGRTRGDLVFDQTRVRFPPAPGRPAVRWEIDDYYPYDQIESEGFQRFRFPVSDIRLRAGIEPRGDGAENLGAGATIQARGHEFRFLIAGTTVSIERRSPAGGELGVLSGTWETLTREQLARAPFAAGRITNVEFWHSDQRLSVWINGEPAASAEYEWTPAERIRFATGRSLGVLLEEQSPAILGEPRIYLRPQARLTIENSPAVLHRVAVDRDLHYSPYTRVVGESLGRGVDPRSTMRTGPDQFFACGDNSPSSLDGRAWPSHDPWVHALIDPTDGVVPRELLLGRAFFVYFPSLLNDSKFKWTPDFGRMRFFW